ncbi:MAG: antitoxin Xre/MbcA/ParS toxin-binding domain-containing protein [Trueperaceae bacterium]|nr:antitoxin Xre/MbcA/ParS toxin-binding domain-containing protein [Trueperaceae bacterium]
MASATFVPTHRPDPLPGARLLGLEGKDEFEVAERIHGGLPTDSVTRLAEALGLAEGRILEVLDLTASTHHDRKRRGRPLSPEASSRVYRVAKTVDAARDFFEGDEDAGRRWLLGPKLALGGATPLAFARTPEGSDYVIKLLGRMEHGIVS